MRHLKCTLAIAAAAGLLFLTPISAQASTIDAFTVNDYKANDGITVNSVDLAKAVVSHSGSYTSKTSGTYQVINFDDGSTGLPFQSGTVTFPGGSNRDQFVVVATTTIHITSADVGTYTFDANTDDGYEFSINGTAISTAGDKGASNMLFTYDFASAGDYSLSFLMYEDGGLANMVLAAAKGSHTSFDASAFHLVGSNGQLVPEPGTLALLAAGFLGLLAYAWRKRK